MSAAVSCSDMHWAIRMVWFVLFGWWLGAVWLVGAIAFSASIIFLPVGIVMAQRTWTIMTLKTRPDIVVKEVRVEADG